MKIGVLNMAVCLYVQKNRQTVMFVMDRRCSYQLASSEEQAGDCVNVGWLDNANPSSTESNRMLFSIKIRAEETRWTADCDTDPSFVQSEEQMRGCIVCFVCGHFWQIWEAVSCVMCEDISGRYASDWRYNLLSPACSEEQSSPSVCYFLCFSHGDRQSFCAWIWFC